MFDGQRERKQMAKATTQETPRCLIVYYLLLRAGRLRSSAPRYCCSRGGSAGEGAPGMFTCRKGKADAQNRKGQFGNGTRDNGWRENPDIPAEDEEEEEALAKT